MFGRNRFKIHKAENTTNNCSALVHKGTVYGLELDGYVYFSIDKVMKVPLGQENCLEMTLGKLSKGSDGNFQIEVLPNFNNAPLRVLRQFYTYIPNSYCILERSNFNFWSFVRLRDFEEFEKSDVSLSFIGRYEASDSAWCETKTVTYREVRKFVYSLDFLPPPALTFIHTYIPKGEFWVVYGGMILKTTAGGKAVNQLENSIKTCDMPKDKMREILDNCIYLSDAVWKYHAIQNKWELLLPSTKSQGVQPSSRPRGRVAMMKHHVDRKKIYYLCRDFITGTIDFLFEYDYQLDCFNKIALKYPISNQQSIPGVVMDFSNDTLILSVRKRGYKNPRILVFCFQTHQMIRVKLTSKWSEDFTNDAICLSDNFDRLVFIPGNILTNLKIHYVDWGKVKKTFLNPLLEKYRCKHK